ncbi:MAG: PKD domain-containing protein [Saprospiraceae bacterium]|nr:PKD domain-containing protein [Saprospiraceae bacterium]MCF8252004.1 PKD domain-containing protein [Saprospiraceae bacterium]MCF8313649.1 PKD domain-containing protein [Saprospiraceae bacterium]MCF8442356.1 PKD domain-containing protein [Saprospiraceae bacterium]
MGSSSGLPKYSSNTGTNEEVITYHYAGTNPIDLFALVYGESGAYAPCNSYKLRLEWQPDAPCVAITLSTQTTPASSGTSQDGSVLLNITGGQPPLAILWSNGQTTQDLTNVPAGSYSVTVTGDDGCTKTATAYVGISGSADPYCSGTATLTQPSGSFSDGSGSSNDYAAYSNCRWLINPANATSITLFFPFFNLSGGDVVEVYDGSSVNSPLLATLDNTTLTNIYHSTGGSMYVRFISDGIDEGQGWTASYTSESSSGGPKLVAYEYWFGDDAAGRQQAYYTPVTTKNLNTSFNTDGLAQGVHRFHIRFLDEYDNWSSVLSQFFVKQPVAEPNNTIEEYEYWFDDDYTNRNSGGTSGEQTFELNETVYESAQLVNGVHRFHVRFKDRAGNWSSVLSQFFVRQPGGGNFPNKVAAYRYWFDLSDAAMNNVTLPSPVNPYELSPSIAANSLSDGQHSVHFQFLDINGNWSSVLSETFEKTAATVAVFTYANVPCTNGQVAFTNTSTGANTWLWQFGDGGTSTSASPTHQYATNGTYTVTLTATNSASGASNTLSSQVQVTNTAITATITPQGSTQLCQGQSVSLQANTGSGFTYQWKLNGTDIVGATASTYTATQTGDYRVVVTSGPNCSATSLATLVSVNAAPSATATPVGAPTVCAGNTVTLNANTGTGLTWQWQLNGGNIAGATASSYATNTGGNYTVVVTNAINCTAVSSPVNVVINALPTIAATANDLSLCLGQSATLTGSGGITYTWQPGNLSGTPVIVSPTVSTVYTVSGTDANGCSNQGTVSIIVLALPTISADATNAAFCIGGSTDLTANGGVNYLWQPGNLIDPAINVAPTATTNYSVVGTDANGCSNSATVQVTVYPLPTIVVSDLGICMGESGQLSASGAVNYSWSPTAGLDNPNIPNPVASPTMTTVYTVTGTDANTCVGYEEVTVTVNDLPVVDLGPNVIICENATLALHAGVGFSEYLWSTGATTEEMTVAGGAYSVTVVDQNGCSAVDEIIITEEVCNATINALNNNQVQLYPNPNNGNFMLSIISEVSGELTLEIFNPLGQAIAKVETIKSERNFSHEFALAGLPPSVYVLKVRLKGVSYWKTFVVQQ